ncbi:septum formation initiator family protein [Erythrobacter sp. F6033]|uniref:FtsB family cell division protein n=1 Tax=Erythrobacter sp. F6033 TaxID=2926401 RepID=UPI001FF5638B|nr:septum formation initiator family protein [Erythrobacter sp. F6033]MCK0128326.1 septum formation initiator family protein [Erythrobacter sp. F6033]
MRKPAKEQMRQGLALFVLLVLTGLAIAGPTGLLAWSENSQALEQRTAQIAMLTEKRDALKNRVQLLNPKAADADLASELVRRNLGVLHADEVVITIEDE